MEVQWADQQKINEFSKLNSRLVLLEDKEKKLRENKDDLEDLAVDVELVDDDDMLLYHIGEIFAFMRKVDIVERVDKDVEDLGRQIEDAEAEKSAAAARMTELKEALYAKFGRDNINLERE